MIEQLPHSDWTETAAPLPVCTLPFDAAALGERHGLRFELDEDYGLGPRLSSVVRAGDLVLWLESHLLDPDEAKLVTVFVRSDVENSLDALQTVLTCFRLQEPDLAWRSDCLGPARWALMRLDDNGNEVEMKRYQLEVSAQWMSRQYEKRGHKQLYFVRHLD